MTGVLVTLGDSLTEHGTWPDLLSAGMRRPVLREGRAGQTSTEIALRAGAHSIDFTTGDAAGDTGLALRPLRLPGDFRSRVDGGMADVAIVGDLEDRAGTLVHRVAATADAGWTFHADDGGTMEPRERMHFQPHALPLPPSAIVVLWCGRNNPGPAVPRDVDAILSALRSRDPGLRHLVLGVHAAAFEPVGTSASALIDEMNATLAHRHAERFIDVRAALLATAPTRDGTPAPHLRIDDVHLSAAGDEVVARVVRERLTALGWWPATAGPPS
ncbi:hypothetical protein [Microbacterium sp.]|uniref:hypothetical protein n=1 Tax=Microbacterium sp. TaxID=51671 RepID=UPI0033426749